MNTGNFFRGGEWQGSEVGGGGGRCWDNEREGEGVIDLLP